MLVPVSKRKAPHVLDHALTSLIIGLHNIYVMEKI